LVAVEEVPGLDVVVAELELEPVSDDVTVVVGAVVVVGVELVELDDELELLLVVLALRQSLAESLPIVDAPCPRFRLSVGETCGGSLTTALLNCCRALAAVPQLPADTA
jgi:hypothetical protein